MLILASNSFAGGARLSCFSDFAEEEAELIMTPPEIDDCIRTIYLEIELNNLICSITEIHRLVSVFILPNRIVPLDYDFRGIAITPIPIKYCSPVPIFIKGHALLN
jgi:hypothetical protein